MSALALLLALVLGAAAIALTALWPLLLAGTIRAPLPHALLIGIGSAIAAVFLARGVAGYLPAWRRGHALEPFATWDRRFYAPLCLLVAAGYAALLLRSASP